ncbi:MAG: 16S rRNA (adenine(1518)-N(6)/adenine(1519)-N(6))-dimethyltransferase RsmA [Arsenophonus sp.]
MNKKIHQGHFARKRFGQNFLTNQFIIDDIVTTFNPKPDQAILEVGPGLGALTLPICDHIKIMTVVELDRDLANRLATNPTLRSKVIIIQTDVMRINFETIAKKKGKPIRIIGNIPYNISIPLIFRLFTCSDAIADITFMLQKEVADRLSTGSNTKSYGRLSVMSQYHYQITHILTVPPSAFTPSPKVHSNMVCLTPHQQNPYPICDVKLLNHITRQAFNQRRKTIRNSLSNLFFDNDFKQIDINPNCRPENISVESYCRLARRLSEKLSYNDNFSKTMIKLI